MPSHPRSRNAPPPSERRGSPERVAPAWHAWLQALASDAEAALGAALMYEALDDPGRDAFLDALEHDAARVAVPKIAVFAPLLSVERDETRRERIKLAMGEDLDKEVEGRPVALIGSASNGEQVVVVATPLYLDFVRMTVCRFSTDRGVAWVRDEPLVHKGDVPASGGIVDQVQVEPVPLSVAVDQVARGIVAHRRREGRLPDSLQPLLELFGTHFATAERTGPR